MWIFGAVSDYSTNVERGVWKGVERGKCKWGVGDTIGKKWMEKFWTEKMRKKLLSAKSD